MMRFLSVLAMAASAWAWQNPGPGFDRIKFDLPYPIIVQGHTLEPGNYSIREQKGAGATGTVQITSDNGTDLNLTAAMIPTKESGGAPESEWVLRQVGSAYYLTKIFIQGVNHGYDFPLPEKAIKEQQKLKTGPAYVHIPGQWARSGNRMNLTSSQPENKPVAVESDRERHARLDAEVAKALNSLPNYGVFDHLSHVVNDGAVVLLGQVTLPALKTEAETAVKTIEGVQRVRDEIQVLPLSPENDRIRRDAYDAIYKNSELAKYGASAVPAIHIIVMNRVVALEGVVTNATDRDLAAAQVKTVPGVALIVNNLRLAQ